MAMKTICLSNFKGGVGKSTAVINLAYHLADLGRRVLMMDLDYSGSLTLAADRERSGRSIAEVIGGINPGRLQLHEILVDLGGGITLAPGDIALTATEAKLISRWAREDIIKKILAGVASDFDVCLIDTSPALGILTLNALNAADGVITPVLPTALDLRGLRLFLDALEEIREGLNPRLQLLGVLICQYDSRINLHNDAVEEIRRSRLPVFETMISKSVKIAQAAGAGEPARGVYYDQFRQIAEEIEKWLKAR